MRMFLLDKIAVSQCVVAARGKGPGQMLDMRSADVHYPQLQATTHMLMCLMQTHSF